MSSAPLVVVEGGPEARREVYAKTRRGFLVTNYEQVVRDLDAIAAWGADLVVLDEAQRIKNWSTRTALTIKHLHPTYRLVLTGTPMENRLEELASIVEWVDDRALDPKWRRLPLHSAYADGTREVTPDGLAGPPRSCAVPPSALRGAGPIPTPPGHRGAGGADGRTARRPR